MHLIQNPRGQKQHPTLKRRGVKEHRPRTYVGVSGPVLVTGSTSPELSGKIRAEKNQTGYRMAPEQIRKIHPKGGILHGERFDQDGANGIRER